MNNFFLAQQARRLTMDQELNSAVQTDNPQSHALPPKRALGRTRKHPMSQVDVIIGMNLRRMRKQIKLSQSELGKLLGISFQQIQKYEQGINRLTISRALDICGVMHLSISEFISQLLRPRLEE